MSDDTPIGLVLRIEAKTCHVEVPADAPDARIEKLPMRGRLFEERGHSRNVVAVGDRVKVTLGGDDDGAIDEVLPRTSKLARRAKGDEDREQVIAANVSLVLIVAAVKDPPLQPLLIDRILASCERQDLRAAIAFTKIDRDKKGRSNEWVELYQGLGYEVFPCSVIAGKETTDTLDALAAELHRNMTVLTGLSGVGKSSLINHLLPGSDLRIGSMSRIRQGKHTTTHTELLRIPDGGHVLDTPGIRNFGLFGVGPDEVSFYFREIAEIAKECQYRDCSHRDDDGCAVLPAVEAGTIHVSRYDSYLRIREELDEPEY